LKKLDRKQLVITARKDLGLNQTDFAKLLGKKQVIVSQWESGDREILDDTIFRLKFKYENGIQDYDKSLDLFKPYLDEIIGVE